MQICDFSALCLLLFLSNCLFLLSIVIVVDLNSEGFGGMNVGIKHLKRGSMWVLFVVVWWVVCGTVYGKSCNILLFSLNKGKSLLYFNRRKSER